MCSITGAMTLTSTAQISVPTYVEIVSRALERGRDAWGVATQFEVLRHQRSFASRDYDLLREVEVGEWIIGLNRGEPTTESFDVGDDELSPHRSGSWYTVHNGTIANDHEIAQEFGSAVLTSAGIDSRVLPALFDDLAPRGTLFSARDVADMLRERVVGSYALAAAREDALVLACNYKPIFHCVIDGTLYFASLPHHLPGHGSWGSSVQKMEPYSVAVFRRVSGGEVVIDEASLFADPPEHYRPRSLVVLSGGLDSTTVLALLKSKGHDVAAFHVDYGAQANHAEDAAVRRICDVMNVDLIEFETDALMSVGGSTLTDPNGEIHDGLGGSEYAHEWVPARNLILASLAVAQAEVGGFDFIALGNNLEESGAYPDNEQEFIRALNYALPNAVQEGKRVRLIEPVGNLMKHEIVAEGLRVNAPLHLTWSCYRGDTDKHCGRCGPCFMRANAFRMNHVPDSAAYVQTPGGPE